MRDRSNQRNHGEYAVIVLTKTVKVERDHLIHREAVPLPLRREGLNARKYGRDCDSPERPTTIAALDTGRRY